MRIKRIALKQFRRFTNLEISDIPPTVRAVIVAGPNGNGKSSLFDGFLKFVERHHGLGGTGDNEYYLKKSVAAAGFDWNQLSIEFHEGIPSTQSAWRKSMYVRSAYRNDPDFNASELRGQGDALVERRIQRLIENDAAVQKNYHRLIAQGLEDVYEKESSATTIGEFRDKTIGHIKSAVQEIFPYLELNSLGNPLQAGSFKFSKGEARGYHYKNLSGGEKAVFDILSDLIIKKRSFDDTVFCIDEPEAHLNPRVHAKLFEAMFKLIDDKSQLWVTTHSIGILRRARDIEKSNPGSIAIIDFDVDFDLPQKLAPIKIDRMFWKKSLNVALDDLASLVSPQRIIACESAKRDGSPGEGVDASIYNKIFENEFPETQFVSLGSSTDLKGDRFLVLEAVTDMIQGISVLRLVDRDGMSNAEILEHRQRGIKVLGRRHIESYLFDDEVLGLLCDSIGRSDLLPSLLSAKEADLIAAQNNGHAADNVKAAAGRIANSCRRVLELSNSGKSTGAFMRDTLAPLIGPETKIYQEMRRDIFE